MPPKKALGDATTLTTNAAAAAGAAPAASKGAPTIEQTYQKLTQHEHILQRPDTYVGSIESQTVDMFVFNADSGRMEQRKLSYVPALYKVFDEIIVNAADNKARDASMSYVKVKVEKDKGRLSVENDGKGIPIQVHKEHGVYVPELIFGHLLTGSNYNDGEKKLTGGRNGYGAKLANIFSTEFVVETASTADGKLYKQTFKDNMMKTGKASITDLKEGQGDFTRISWVPDLAKFGLEELDDDHCALFERRAYDLAGVTHASVKVHLNGKRIGVNNFSNYVDLYLGSKLAAGASPRVFEKISERWEVAIAPSDDGFQQISFVNSIATTKGGKHVDHVSEQVVDRLLEFIKKKHKGMEKVRSRRRPLRPPQPPASLAARIAAARRLPVGRRPHSRRVDARLASGAQADARQEPPQDLRQLPDREPGLRLTDKRVYDFEAVGIRLQVASQTRPL